MEVKIVSGEQPIRYPYDGIPAGKGSAIEGG